MSATICLVEKNCEFLWLHFFIFENFHQCSENELPLSFGFFYIKTGSCKIFIIQFEWFHGVIIPEIIVQIRVHAFFMKCFIQKGLKRWSFSCFLKICLIYAQKLSCLFFSQTFPFSALYIGGRRTGLNNKSQTIKKRPAEVSSTSLWMSCFLHCWFPFFWFFLLFFALHCASFAFQMPNVSSRLPLCQSLKRSLENRNRAGCTVQRPACPSDSPSRCM